MQIAAGIARSAWDVGVFACLIENCVSALLMNGKVKDSNALAAVQREKHVGIVIATKVGRNLDLIFVILLG